MIESMITFFQCSSLETVHSFLNLSCLVIPNIASNLIPSPKGKVVAAVYI